MNAYSSVPSIELQTVEFVEFARSQGVSRRGELQRGGFRVTLEYQPECSFPRIGTLKDFMLIADVYVPMRYRSRGWLTSYLKMCLMLVSDGLLVCNVNGPVHDALLRMGFEHVAPGWVMFKK